MIERRPPGDDDGDGGLDRLILLSVVLVSAVVVLIAIEKILPFFQ